MSNSNVQMSNNNFLIEPIILVCPVFETQVTPD
jgi:hypothetical protein